MGHFDRHIPEVQAEAELARKRISERDRAAEKDRENQEVIASMTREFLTRMRARDNPGMGRYPQCRAQDVGQPWVTCWSGWAIETNCGRRYLHEASGGWMADLTSPGWVGWNHADMRQVDAEALARSLAVILATHKA
jgi:hypothetical protein